MAVKLRQGLRWGYLRVVDMGQGELTIDRGGGVEETFTRADYADCECACGGTIRIFVRQWKGPRAIRDCGCGWSHDEGARTITTVTMPLRVRRQVVKHQRAEGVSFTQAVLDLVGLGLRWKIEHGVGGHGEIGEGVDDADSGDEAGSGPVGEGGGVGGSDTADGDGTTVERSRAR